MKYTDGLFSLPIKVYDAPSLRRARKLEEEEDIQQDGDWVEGKIKIPFQEIQGFVDYYSVGRTPEEVAKEGFDCCLVMTKSYGDFNVNECAKSVEARLNKFAEEYEKSVEKLAREALLAKKLIQEAQKPVKKKRFWL